MSIFVDILILLIFAICIFLGYKKGLVQVILNLCSFLLALVISLVLFKPLSLLVINNTSFDDNIKSYIIEIVNQEESSETSSNESSGIISQYIDSSIQKAAEDTKDNVVEYVADAISKNIVSIIVLLILFVLLRFVLIFIKIISNAITELPIIKQFNNSGGILYGLLQALLIIYVVFTIIALFIKNGSIEQAISASYIGSIFYNNNLILMLLFK